MVLRLRPEAQEPGLGRRFLQEVRQAFHRIRSNPEAYAEGYRNTRRALIRRFIVVLAVLHCGRDPTLWRQRSCT